MANGYKIRNQQSPHFLTFQIVFWIDIFSRKEYRHIIIEAFNYCIAKKQLNVHAYVVMSNHIHCILSTSKVLSDIVRDFKRHTSKQMFELVSTDIESRKLWMVHQFKFAASRHNRNTEHQIWTNDDHPIELIPY